jgi:membrane fusion protein, multidrug efflux system
VNAPLKPGGDQFLQYNRLSDPHTCGHRSAQIALMRGMESKSRGSLYRSLVLFAALASIGIALFFWRTLARGDEPAPTSEPSEIVEIVAAEGRRHGRTTTAIGTVVAAHSITLRNEVPGTVARIAISPGALVNAGDVLLQLDVSLERAELASFEAQARLAQARLARLESLSAGSAVSKMDVDTARAESEIALAQVQRVRALIARKTLRAPFRARVGITDVNVGQYLAEGQLLTTLQSIDELPFIDFRVAQAASRELHTGAEVAISLHDQPPIKANLIAMDSLVEASSRSIMVRARALESKYQLTPGSAVTVQLPVTLPRDVVAVPASAVRRGPDGDFVFVIRPDSEGALRAHQQKIVVDSMENDAVMVIDGLAPGDSVAAAGSFKLRDALRVTKAKT